MDIIPRFWLKKINPSSRMDSSEIFWIILRFSCQNKSTRIWIFARFSELWRLELKRGSLRHKRVLSMHSYKVFSFWHCIRPEEAITLPLWYKLTNTASLVDENDLNSSGISDEARIFLSLINDSSVFFTSWCILWIYYFVLKSCFSASFSSSLASSSTLANTSPIGSDQVAK